MVEELEMQISDSKHPKVGNKMVHAHLFSATGTDSRLENFTCPEILYTAPLALS